MEKITKYLLMLFALFFAIGFFISCQVVGATVSAAALEWKYFKWHGIDVGYKKIGGLTFGGTAYTPAERGDYEIVGFGASHGSGTGNVNIYFDKSKMESQGFKAIAVRGLDDRKVEMWIRKNSGQDNIYIPRKARVFTFLIINGKDADIIMTAIVTAKVFSSGIPYKVPNPSGSGLKIICYFSDDPMELTNVGNGKIIYQKWGFGDGDGFAMVLYAPGIPLPGSILVNSHGSGGKQYAGIGANFIRL